MVIIRHNLYKLKRKLKVQNQEKQNEFSKYFGSKNELVQKG